MKNFKKVIAMGISFAIAAIMSVSAMAAGTGTDADPYTEAYVDGAVVVDAIKDALPEMAASSQYTVVVVPVGEEISDSNIYYINQAAGNDAVWAATTTWGTPAVLTDGDYVVRVGDEAGNVEEIFFSIGSTEEPPAGDPVPVVTFMNGATTFATVDTVDGKATLPTTAPELAATTGYVATAHAFVEWVDENGAAFTADTVVEADTTVYPKFKVQAYKAAGNKDILYGDCNSDGLVNASDRTLVHRWIGGTQRNDVAKPISPLLKITVKGVEKESIAGDCNADGVVNATDRTLVHRWIGGTQRNDTGKNVYVINK